MNTTMTGRKSDIDFSFIKSLRRANQLQCHLDGCSVRFADSDERIKAHYTTNHKDLLENDKVNLTQLIAECRRSNQNDGKVADRSNQANSAQPPRPFAKDERHSSVPDPSSKDSKADDNKSPETPPTTTRSRAAKAPSQDPAFSRRQPQTTHRGLYDPNNPSKETTPVKPKQQNNRGKKPDTHSRSAPTEEPSSEDEPIAPLIKQPETRPISQEQLVAEVKGIYAGLVMVESKCIEVDNAQSSQSGAKLNNEQWQALIALHRTLLHEHHDFFLASQHPSANPALRRLASKYAMPARMWRHGIHSFLELLRHRLPASLEHMLTFIYLAYSMMALLYETVPAFEDTWIECLGDLGRYRMAIEDDDIRDREVWTSVSRHWYSKASDKSPTTGRLYHHLAILARPNALQQLFYYTKSLCVPTPFTSARDSIMTLFDPILNATAQKSRLPAIDSAFVKAHGILFSGKCEEDFSGATETFFQDLDNHIGRSTRRWMEAGYYIGISNCCALLSYGKDDNFIFQIIRPPRTDDPADVTMEEPSEMPATFKRALHLTRGTQEVVFRRLADPNVLPYVHTVLVFMDHLTSYPTAMGLIETSFPWGLASSLLNSLLLSYRDYERIESADFPRPEKELPRPLPEDFAMKGLLWVDKYYPNDFFRNDKIDDDEKYFEVASMTEERIERILWLARRIAAHNKWLTYDNTSHKFGVTTDYEPSLASKPLEQNLSTDMDDTEMSSASDMSETASEPSTIATPKNMDQGDQWMMDVDEASQSGPIVKQ